MSSRDYDLFRRVEPDRSLVDILSNRYPQGDPNLPRHGEGNGFKRNGFLGPIRVPGTEDYATEYSIADDQGEMPTMVPTLSREELDELLRSMRTRSPIPKSVEDKAYAHATMRRILGLSPFAGDNESPVPTRHPGPWRDEYVLPNPPAGKLNAVLSSFRK